MKIDVDVKGVEKAIAKLQKYSKAKKSGMVKVIKNNSGEVKKDQRSNVPTLSGLTRDSIGIKYSEGGLVARIGPMGPDGFKANWIENGTGGSSPTPAHPFIFPSGERNRPKYLKDAKDELGRIK